MRSEAWDRLFGYQHAFEHPVTVWATLAIGVMLLATPLIVWLLAKSGKVDGHLRAELMLRYRSWLVLTPLILVPILLGAAWTILGVCVLSLWCYREFARATGLFREKTVSIVVVLGILSITFATIDHWYGFFVALVPFTIGTLAIAAILKDQPKGYIQRVALGVMAFMLFGSCPAHLGYFANDLNYRPILILLFLSVELNDIFAFICGKTMGHRKLIPNTSPKKTVAGAIGAVILTTLLVMLLGYSVFRETPLANWFHLSILGILVSVLGQFGDLMLSSIKRDIGIKDMAATIPGHGGLLDRFDSIILVAPAVFHYVGYFLGVGTEQQTRIFSGG